jgi:hypothetical protein
VKHRCLALLSGAAAGALLAATAVSVGAQSAPGIPRTPDGKPDLQGVWNYATVTPLERPKELANKEFLTPEEAEAFAKQTVESRDVDANRSRQTATADVGSAYNNFWYDRGSNTIGTRRTSLVIDPPDGRVPALTAEAQARAAARAAARKGRGPADGPEDRGLSERCVMFGAGPPVLPGPYNNNLQIFQTSTHVVILNEMIHDARIIPLDGRPAAPDAVRPWQGVSRGRWEGDTLVVETTNFSTKTNFRNTSDRLRLVERFRRADADTLMYEFTVNDPSSYTKPWTASLPMARSDEPIFEYACHEGNEGMFGILKGARADEKAAEAQKR